MDGDNICCRDTYFSIRPISAPGHTFTTITTYTPAIHSNNASLLSLVLTNGNFNMFCIIK